MDFSLMPIGQFAISRPVAKAHERHPKDAECDDGQ
jgi:hypothetical protein